MENQGNTWKGRMEREKSRETENQKSRQQDRETESRESVQQDREPGGLWTLLKSGSVKMRGTRLKKDQLLIGLLTGVLLIVIALPVDKGKEEKSQREQEQGQLLTGEGETGDREAAFSGNGEGMEIQGTAADAYTREMEERLSEALSQVEGVGRVKVLITWKTSSEKVVEKDMPSSSQNVEEEDGAGGKRTTTQEGWEEETVYRQEADGSRIPYVVKEIRPQAEGVLVIAQGGGNSVTARNILEAVQALFPLDSHKIKIMKMEGSK